MNKRFHSLDSFRGICALCVVIYHLHVSNTITELSFFRNSDLLVEFFFVLSGFVICHGYGNKKNLEFSYYFKNRFFRLFPLHIFMLLCFVFLEILKYIAWKYFNFGFNVKPFTGVFSLSEIIPNFFLIQSWSDSFQAYSFNTPSWSISVEFYIYFILFFTMKLFKKLQAIIWVILSTMAFFFIYIKSDFLTIYVLRGISCFFLGVLTYQIYKIFRNLNVNYFIISTLELLCLFLFLVLISFDYENKNIIISLYFSVMVFIFSFDSGVVSLVLKGNRFQELGKLSYSIYLIHASIIFIVLSLSMVLGKVINENLTPMIDNIRYFDFGNIIVNNIFVILIIVITVFLSRITYSHIEMKFIKYSKSKSKSNINLNEEKIV